MVPGTFSGGPVGLDSRLSLPGALVGALVRELRSYKPCGTAKEKKKKELQDDV